MFVPVGLEVIRLSKNRLYWEVQLLSFGRVKELWGPYFSVEAALSMFRYQQSMIENFPAPIESTLRIVGYIP